MYPVVPCDESVSDESVLGTSVLGRSVPGGSVPGGSVPGGSVHGGSIPGGSILGSRGWDDQAVQVTLLLCSTCGRNHVFRGLRFVTVSQV